MEAQHLLSLPFGLLLVALALAVNSGGHVAPPCEHIWSDSGEGAVLAAMGAPGNFQRRQNWKGGEWGWKWQVENVVQRPAWVRPGLEGEQAGGCAGAGPRPEPPAGPAGVRGLRATGGTWTQSCGRRPCSEGH